MFGEGGLMCWQLAESVEREVEFLSGCSGLLDAAGGCDCVLFSQGDGSVRKMTTPSRNHLSSIPSRESCLGNCFTRSFRDSTSWLSSALGARPSRKVATALKQDAMVL